MLQGFVTPLNDDLFETGGFFQFTFRKNKTLNIPVFISEVPNCFIDRLGIVVFLFIS